MLYLDSDGSVGPLFAQRARHAAEEAVEHHLQVSVRDPADSQGRFPQGRGKDSLCV